jgi:hypothetical protein
MVNQSCINFQKIELRLIYKCFNILLLDYKMRYFKTQGELKLL